MASALERPRLRPVETIVVPDSRHGRVLVLRDTQGIAPGHAAIPPDLVPVVALFTGDSTCDEIARRASREIGRGVPADLVVAIARELDEGLFLYGDTFDRARRAIEHEFTSAPLRPASHAGGAYHADPDALRRYLDEDCIARARASAPHARASAPGDDRRGRMVALVAPHIDPWRGAVGYGHAYGALADRLGDDVDTFVLLGTSHAPMRAPFALCKKSFATPLGAVAVHEEAVDALARAATFDPYQDVLNHKREHSLEFQAVFLAHLLAQRPRPAAPPRIVPILAGLGEHQAAGNDPGDDASVDRFLGAIADLVASRPGRVVVVAGADLAHVGPRFGDPAFDAAQRADLEARDRASLDLATARDPAGFWGHVSEDLETRRVCGLAPIYALLRALPGHGDLRGEVLHYEQTVDAEDGSIVSHAGVGFFSG